MLKKLCEVETALGNQENVLPALAERKLQRISQVKSYGIPGVPDDVDQLEPGVRVLGVLGCSGHNSKEFVHPFDSLFLLELILLIVLFVFLFEGGLELLVVVVVLLQDGLVLREINLKDISENASLGKGVEQRPLALNLPDIEE